MRFEIKTPFGLTGLNFILLIPAMTSLSNASPKDFTISIFLADPSSRSMPLTGTCDIINQLKKDYAVIIMSEFHFSVEEDEENSRYPVARPQIPDMRTWAAVIEVADHFLGCDSMGQHMARALDKTVYCGTFK